MELKAFDVGLGQYCEDGSPCVVAFDDDRNPRLLNEKVYLKSEADKVIAHQKYKRCLAMANWCEATALWCYQAANTLPVGIHATLYGKPVMIEPKRLFKRFMLLNKWHKRWLELAEQFKPNNSTAQ